MDAMDVDLRTTFANEAAKMSDLIWADEGILDGIPVIAGTRIPVATVLYHLAKGYTTAELIDDFPSLNAEKIRAALMYATHLTALKG